MLRKIDPGLFVTVMHRAAAVPGDKSANAVLFFPAALKRGDFTAWFGDEAAEALEHRGRVGLLNSLRQNFNQQIRLAESSAPGE